MMPVSRDRFMMKVKGFAITGAAYFNRPGARLSKPVAFFRLNFFNSFRTSASFTALKMKVSFAQVIFTGTGLLQIKSRS